MTSNSSFASWFDAIRQVAANEGIDLPKATSQAMGTVLWQDGSGERAFSIRTPLRKRSQGTAKALHWAAWESTRPSSPILEGRENGVPENSRAKWLVTTIYEWITKKVSPDEIRQQ